MEKNSIGDKIITVIIVSILACLFTGGIAASLHWHVPTICIITVLVICGIVFGND